MVYKFNIFGQSHGPGEDRERDETVRSGLAVSGPPSDAPATRCTSARGLATSLRGSGADVVQLEWRVRVVEGAREEDARVGQRRGRRVQVVADGARDGVLARLVHEPGGEEAGDGGLAEGRGDGLDGDLCLVRRACQDGSVCWMSWGTAAMLP